MTNDTLSFLKTLDYNDGLSVALSILHHFPMQYGATTGLDGKAQIRPLEFKFEKDGALFFDTTDFYESYREMQKNPFLQLCIGEQKSMFYLRISGKVNFTKNKEIVDLCFKNSPVLTSQFGDKREHVVAYYLTQCKAEFQSFSSELPRVKKYELRNKYDE